MSALTHSSDDAPRRSNVLIDYVDSCLLSVVVLIVQVAAMPGNFANSSLDQMNMATHRSLSSCFTTVHANAEANDFLVSFLGSYIPIKESIRKMFTF